MLSDTAYAPRHVEKIAKALHDATKIPGASSWAYLVKVAEAEGGTAAEIRNHWLGLAIAALDMTYGVRQRLEREGNRV